MLLTLVLATIAFAVGYRRGKRKDLMGPAYPPQLSGIFVGCLLSGVIILISLAVNWLFFASN